MNFTYDDYEVVTKEEPVTWAVPKYNKVPVLTTKDKYINKLVKKELKHTHVLGHGHGHGGDDHEMGYAQLDPAIQNELGF